MAKRSFISLKPYGASLCTPAARLWMASSAVAVLLMALAEAAAWSYVGWFLGTSIWRGVSAAIVGLTVFTLVWILDSTLLTLDTTRHEHKEFLKRLSVPVFGFDTTQPSRFIRFLRSGGLGIFARIGMVVGSLLISSPYLTQLVFLQDVSAVLQKQDATKVTELRRQLATTLDTNTRLLVERETSLRQELIREVAGKGPSGRFGRGPTVKVMEARLQEIQTQIETAERERARQLAAFDRLAPDQLTRQYGVLLQSGGIQARSAAMDVVKQQPGYLMTEWTVRAFMFGLFLAVLILKLFQPHSVEVYYSEARQDCYARYLTGQFDGMLSEKERVSAGGSITPLRFDEWFRVDYLEYLQQARLMAEMGAVNTHYQTSEEKLRAIESSAQTDMQPLLEDYDAVVTEVATIRNQLLEIESSLQSTEQQVSAHQKSIEALSSAIKYPRAVGAEEYLYVLDTRKEWTTGLEGLEGRRRELTVEQQKLSAQLNTREAEVKRIESNIAARSGVLEQAAARITDARKRALDALDKLNARKS
ncbi:MAG TPA: DUF4407 domain-containing protein [Thermoanaerobaculia bacterium]|jgi:hypothetical protein